MPPIGAQFLPTTLIQRRATLWLLGIATPGVMAIWLSETVQGLNQPYDRWAQPLLMLTLGVLWLFAWRRRDAQGNAWAAGLAALATSIYLGAVPLYLIVSKGAVPDSYALASLLPWAMLMYLLLFFTWAPRPALCACLLLFACVNGGTVWMHHRGGGDIAWRQVGWPLFTNGLLAQVLLLLAVMGLARLRQVIERAHLAAQAASAAKSRFLAVMSHELRTPLHGVLAAADLLRDTPPDSAARAGLVQTISNSGQHLLGLIDRVLDLSHIESGRLDARREAFDVQACISAALAAVASQAAAKGLALEQAVDLGASGWRMGDGLRLRQVLINLLANAVKFTREGSVRLDVVPSSAGSLRFTVADTGVGIPAAMQASVFEAFRQLDDGSARSHGGVGLGLAITREIVQQLGGHIALDSAPGAGTRMSVELPLPLSARAAAEAARASGDAPGTGLPSLAGMRVLLVEDDAVNLLLVREMLVRAGIEVLTATGGQAALDALQREAFDVVLMDWQMPGLDGLETTRRVRAGVAGERAARTRILGLTANAFDDSRATCIDAGMDDVLTKPVLRETLLQGIARLARP
jgi:signal transduction histidine kinase